MPFAEQDVHHGTLQIRGVQELDAGEYTCVATNAAGSTSAVVRLEVGGENISPQPQYMITAPIR